MINYFTQHLPKSSNQYNYQFWFEFRRQVLMNNPTLKHDVAALRFQTYLIGIKSLGFSDMQANKIAHSAMETFNFHRSNFTVPKKSHLLLKELSKKYPLVAISNGNVNTETIGIAHYFNHIYHADLSKQQKPSSAMFSLACQDLSIEPHHLLHVGDCGHSDIYGAIKAGCQSAWLSRYTVGKPLSMLPNIEIADITELHKLA
ncbi:haloacid dehalogenase [Thalassotalea profundi]|uniref:Haloacid dehalogenase n=2 Tax=Thalassotalea profundi TaxID=2036687 RepID=A0ABQ3IQG6_9GAMM|nr:haloacid dehalogenase [Thalassotalea profundi]